ncbi:MAG: PspA/IM30 family protein [Sarcina sp.]
MGIFNRISNIVKSKTNKALDQVENPVEMLDQKIRDVRSALNEANKASAQVIGSAKDTERKMKESKKASEDYEEKVKFAMSKGNEELAKKALTLKLENDKKYDNLKATYTAQKSKVDVLKANLTKLKSELEKLESYRDEASARLENANATKAINEIVNNIETKSNSINLDDIERSINKKESYAEGLSELSSPSLDDEFAELETMSLDSELDKYRTSNSSPSSSIDSLEDELSKYK